MNTGTDNRVFQNTDGTAVRNSGNANRGFTPATVRNESDIQIRNCVLTGAQIGTSGTDFPPKT